MLHSLITYIFRSSVSLAVSQMD